MLILSSSPRLFGSIAYEMTGSGNLIGGMRTAALLSAMQVAGLRVLQLGDGAEVAGLDLRHVRLRLALQQHEVAEPLRRLPRHVVHRRVRPERARNHPEQRDASGERIGDGLPYEGRGRARLDCGDGDVLLAALVLGVERTLGGRLHVAQ